MKYQLKEKYVPPSYRQRLLEQLSSMIQGSNSIAECMAQFDEFLIRCDLDEETSFILARFKNRLHSDIRHALSTYSLESLNHVFQQALEIEHDLMSSLCCHEFVSNKCYSNKAKSTTNPTRTEPLDLRLALVMNVPPRCSQPKTQPRHPTLEDKGKAPVLGAPS